MLGKLRYSNHPLLTEVGKHHEMDFNIRKCNLCNKVEDGIHFITQCQLYTETRNKFFSGVGISRNDCTKAMFVSLLTSKNEQLIQSIAQFTTNYLSITIPIVIWLPRKTLYHLCFNISNRVH